MQGSVKTKSHLGIVIDSKEVWEMITGLNPHFAELSYEENIGNFLVFGLAGANWSIVGRDTFSTYFETMEPRYPIKVKEFFLKH